MMADECFSIEEAARYLRVPRETVEDWAKRGEIPADLAGGGSIQKSALEKWIYDRLSPRRTVPRIDKERLGAMIAPERILMLEETGKERALLALAENLASARGVTSRDELVGGILEREALMSTAIGKGIAIPHIRLASVKDLVVSVGIARGAICDFNPLDDEPVRLIIMIAAAYDQHAYYLQTLSYFSRRLKHESLYAALLAAKDTAEAYRLLIDEAPSLEKERRDE
jgi:PTS system nitrogen regulatory IIA component